MRKPSALLAWKMLVLSLPKGIGAFIIIVAGLSVSLPLSVVLIGLPLLAGTLVLSRRIMVDEAKFVEGWLQGKEYPAAPAEEGSSGGAQQGWKSWFSSVMKDGRSYRAILFGILQLPVGIAAFTFAIVLPTTAFAVLLSPAAYEVGMRWFEFDLFAQSWGLDRLVDWELTSAHRSWIAGGVGLLLTLLQPLLMKGLGRLYAAWILSISGPEPERQPSSDESNPDSEFPFSMMDSESSPFRSERSFPPVN
ncbi:sensor domain-containing protein [Paenibacillus sp. 1P07SE]|uniref:sensor domain-containing protein n=1 Tax=Paenibacillus sp. 1P07SE TaxID=3132209 RepID=UPI0039A7519F